MEEHAVYRVLMVEDDRGIAQAVQTQGQLWNLEVRQVQDLRHVMEEFAAFDPHLVLLDIGLPCFDGYHWCTEIRRVSRVPVIFISSAADNMNIIMAMNLGADDFIAKPFDQSVLMAKIQALLRRTYDFGASAPVLEHRGALLNTGDNTLTYQGQRVSLTKNEYRILLCLMQSKGREEQRYGDMVDYYTMWAHQIKTPIASMRLTLQNEDSGLARSLSGDLMRVEQYVEMVLVFLRLDSSTTDYVIRSHSLDDIVRPAVRKFAGEFIRRRLRLDYQPLDRTVVTDAKWLGFVVEQVLSNALKYTASGSVTIAMDGDDLCIRDTGMGIAPEDLPRIFDRGFTGLNGRRDTRASGIGLYLCRRICRSLGHTIRASSVPNQGTEIRIGLGQKKTLPE